MSAQSENLALASLSFALCFTAWGLTAARVRGRRRRSRFRYAGSCGALPGVGLRARRRRLAVFPPLVMGAEKDAAGTYTIGFVGLLVFTLSMPRRR